MKISRDNGIYAVYGGLFLGGGGGGSLQEGIDALEEALKHSESICFAPLSQFEDDDAVITASMVGAPSSREKHVVAEHWKKALKLFEAKSDKKIKGIITNENGGTSTTNGWILSSLTNIPMIDAPCNGRAHPTGTMGSMGLTEIEGFVTVQAAAGGRGSRNIELIAEGSISSTSRLVRQAAVEAGGLACVLRNPVQKSYVQQHGAVGAIGQAVEIGEIIVENKGDVEVILNKLSNLVNAEVLCRGTVIRCTLTSTGGFDVGSLLIEEGGTTYETTFWNEYMTVDAGGVRLATFPDLIATLDAKTGVPVTSAEIGEDMDVVLVKVPRSNIKLGGGMFQKSLFEEAEKVTGKELIKYSF
ncbi:MAG: DUF917 family protein [Sedimentibacter sp.]|uniref:S-methyl thiohydantoin desulfurase domain-containing protein n=1 Tax=Sedimentibacter sp. TaxID=1960295 RepID=UPI0031590289